MKTLKVNQGIDEPVTTRVLAQAIERGRKNRSEGLHATAVQYLPSRKCLLIDFADQSAVALPVKNYRELAKLSANELDHLIVGFGGAALCLEERDLHVSIAGLVLASKPLMALAVTMIAARNGSRSSTAKALASRENGLKGGRPRKQVAAD